MNHIESVYTITDYEFLGFVLYCLIICGAIITYFRPNKEYITSLILLVLLTYDFVIYSNWNADLNNENKTLMFLFFVIVYAIYLCLHYFDYEDEFFWYFSIFNMLIMYVMIFYTLYVNEWNIYFIIITVITMILCAWWFYYEYENIKGYEAEKQEAKMRKEMGLDVDKTKMLNEMFRTENIENISEYNGESTFDNGVIVRHKITNLNNNEIIRTETIIYSDKKEIESTLTVKINGNHMEVCGTGERKKQKTQTNGVSEEMEVYGIDGRKKQNIVNEGISEKFNVQGTIRDVKDIWTYQSVCFFQFFYNKNDEFIFIPE